MAAQEVGRMSERGILKTLIVYLLIGCFLVSNVSCAYASSEVSVDFYDSMTEPSEEKIQLSQEEVQNSEEKSESSEDIGKQTSENDELESENTDVKLSDDKDAQSPENAEEEPTEETEIRSSENSETEFTEEMEENKTSSTENNETVSSENSEAQSSEDTQVQTEDTETQTSGEPQGSEDTESESSYHTGNSYNTWNSYHIEYSEHTKTEDNKYVQSESAQKAASENSGPAENSKPAPPSASVDLHGEKTQVFSGEDILLRLSAVNLITKPVMHVQVIIIPPSGMSVSSSVFVQSGAGQYTTTYELEPGQGRDIEVRIETNQPGDFKVKGRVIYYFGEDKENIEDHTLDLPIQVKEKPYAVKESLPGFTLASLIFVLIGAFILKRR